MKINFLLLALTAFILERFFQPLFSFPFFVFPVFFVAYLLINNDYFSEVVTVIVASLFFDYFFGGRFGFLIISTVLTVLSLFWVKKFIIINGDSFFLILIFSVVFVLEYFYIIATLNGVRIRPDLAVIIILETLLWSAVVLFTSKIKINDSKKI